MEITEKSFVELLNRVIEQPEIYRELILGLLDANGLRIADFATQTEDMCLVAVRQNPNALKYVHKPTKAVCSMAVESAINSILELYTFFDTKEGRTAIETCCMNYLNIIHARRFLENAKCSVECMK